MNNSIVLKGIIDEDFVNYKIPSMTLMFPKCNFKCGEEACQNASLASAKDIIVPIDYLCERYINNKITGSVVCQGLEPMDSFNDLENFISTLRTRYKCLDDVVIYTGYDLSEITEKVDLLSDLKNIVLKFGRFMPDCTPHMDDVLGVMLASDNQYAERVG